MTKLHEKDTAIVTIKQASGTLAQILKEVKGKKEEFENVSALLQPLFRAFVEALYVHRLANNSFTPSGIFEECIGMAGMSVSTQVVHEVVDEGGQSLGYALRKRDDTELGDDWAGLYHSTCTTGRMLDTPEAMIARDIRQADGELSPEEELEFLGVTIHDEPERWSACLTVMHRRKVTPEGVKAFDGQWEIFTEAHIVGRDPRIIDHNWYLLEWVLDEDRPVFADIRGGYRHH